MSGDYSMWSLMLMINQRSLLAVAGEGMLPYLVVNLAIASDPRASTRARWEPWQAMSLSLPGWLGLLMRNEPSLRVRMWF